MRDEASERVRGCGDSRLPIMLMWEARQEVGWRRPRVRVIQAPQSPPWVTFWSLVVFWGRYEGERIETDGMASRKKMNKFELTILRITEFQHEVMTYFCVLR